MRLVGCRFVVAAVLLTVPRIGHGKCGDGPGDSQAIRRARAAADAACNAQRLGCGTAPNQMKYLKCVSGQVNLAVKGGDLPKSCKTAVIKCAANSVCGKPGFVTCCIPRKGRTKCSRMKRAAACTAKGGTVGACASCCDACSAGGCLATTTTTLIHTNTTLQTTVSVTSTSTTTSSTLNCASGCPPDRWNLDGNPLTGPCGCEYQCHRTSSLDPIDPLYTDDNCDGSDGVVDACVYVSRSLGDDTTGTGTRAAPVKTIARALEIAGAGAVPAVCLSGEVYDEAVAVVSGVNIYGGFDQSNAEFAFRRSPSVTTTVRAAGVVFDAPRIDQDTYIEGITIETSTPAMSGGSTYGVRLGGGLGTLFVTYDTVTAAAGADGAAGASGAPPSPPQAPSGNDGQNGCQGMGCGSGGLQPTCTEFGGKGGDGGFNNGAGQGGSLGSGNTTGGTGGTATGACFSRSGNGGAGNPGGNGAQGSAGSGAGSLGTIAAAAYAPADGGDGQQGAVGKGGSGGGGGGGGSCFSGGFCVCNADTGGGGGSGGCGGAGGAPGQGGQGGGGSFGVFAAAGHVVVTYDTIGTGSGGTGGKGGDGAAGQTGGGAGGGGAGNDDSGGGGGGGPGGSGGAGGPGGGGGGGPSACLARSAATMVISFLANSCTPGAPGGGGAGGTNSQGAVATPGSAGTAAATLQIN